VLYRRLTLECLAAGRSSDSYPLAVDSDSHGESTHHDLRETARKRLENIYVSL
jgi:hypothetical protein